MQHTTETPKQYQCRHIFTDGRRCASPCLRQEEFCYYHHTTRKPVANPKQRRSRHSTFHLPLPEDRSAIQASIGEVLQRIAANDIDPRRAGLLLYGLQIASLNLPKTQPTQRNAKPEPVETVEEITIDPTLGILAPRAEVSANTKPKSHVALLIERMLQNEEAAALSAQPREATIVETLQATEDCATPAIKGSVIQTEAAHGTIVSSAVEGPPHLAFAVACSPTQPRKMPFRPEEAHLPPQQRNPLLYLSSLTTASGLFLTRGSHIPCQPEHRAYKQSWR
jgi:hypothetical protein